MGNFLIPGGLYKIYYQRESKKKTPKPLPSYKALILLVNFSERRIYRYQDLKKECPDNYNFTYEAIEMGRSCSPERFTISPGDVAKSVLLKRLKDMRDWPLEAVRVYFSRRGVSRSHIDELYNREIQLENIDFARFHVRAALKQRRTQEKLKLKQSKPSNSVWIEADFTGLCEEGYINFRLTIGDLEPVIYRFGKNSGIESLLYKSEEHSVICLNGEGIEVHRMVPQWPPDVVGKAFERQRVRAAAAASPSNWTGSSTNWATTNST